MHTKRIQQVRPHLTAMCAPGGPSRSRCTLTRMPAGTNRVVCACPADSSVCLMTLLPGLVYSAKAMAEHTATALMRVSHLRQVACSYCRSLGALKKHRGSSCALMGQVQARIHAEGAASFAFPHSRPQRQVAFAHQTLQLPPPDKHRCVELAHSCAAPLASNSRRCDADATSSCCSCRGIALCKHPSASTLSRGLVFGPVFSQRPTHNTPSPSGWRSSCAASWASSTAMLLCTSTATSPPRSAASRGHGP